MLGGAKKTLSKGVALYESEPEETFEGNGTPFKNKNAKTWIEHVKDYRKKHKGISYKKAMIGAKSSYKKGVVKKEPDKKEEVKKEPELRRSSRKTTTGNGAPLKNKNAKTWIEHVKDYREKHKGISYKQAMVEAKSSYKKGVVKKEPAKKEEVKKEHELRRSSRKATVGGAYLREQMKPSLFVEGKKLLIG